MWPNIGVFLEAVLLHSILKNFGVLNLSFFVEYSAPYNTVRLIYEKRSVR